jgi:hypothetical protein
MSDHKPPRSPQEKKALSYERDRRNAYGESDKGARKTIPARKAGENRKDRRKVAQSLVVLPTVDAAAAEMIESDAAQDVCRVGGWTKAPDIPLADHIEKQAKGRTGRLGRKAVAASDR